MNYDCFINKKIVGIINSRILKKYGFIIWNSGNIEGFQFSIDGDYFFKAFFLKEDILVIGTLLLYSPSGFNRYICPLLYVFSGIYGIFIL